MIEPTKEQIEKAREAYANALHRSGGSLDSAGRAALHAAAPFLQLPWEPPTEAEKLFAVNMVASRTKSGSASYVSPTDLIAAFVEMRNAEIIPKTVDSRREKLITIIQTHPSNMTTEDLADKILEGLDVRDDGRDGSPELSFNVRTAEGEASTGVGQCFLHNNKTGEEFYIGKTLSVGTFVEGCKIETPCGEFMLFRKLAKAQWDIPLPRRNPDIHS